MATAIVFEDVLTVPACAGLGQFRQWTRSDGFPARGQSPIFQVFHRGDRAFDETPHDAAGWTVSAVLDRQVRLTVQESPRGIPRYDLEIRSPRAD